MRNKLLYVVCLLLCQSAKSQPGGGVEHYYYVAGSEVPAMVPIVHYNTSADWYCEARYFKTGTIFYTRY